MPKRTDISSILLIGAGPTAVASEIQMLLANFDPFEKFVGIFG